MCGSVPFLLFEAEAASLTLDEAFVKPPTFITNRLVLRPMELADADAMFEMRGDPRVREQYCMEPDASPDQTRRWVEERVAGRPRRDAIFWVYTLKGEERAVGSCCYWNFDESSKRAEIGYELSRVRWHQGITSEALLPVLEYGFGGMGLHRIEACPLAENAASNRLLRNLGFRLEGTLRQRVQFRGRFIDQLYYSLLEGELRRPHANGP